MTVAGLVLAAGGATRFGSPKALATYRGKPLVTRAVRQLVPRCPAGVYVVVGAHGSELHAALADEPTVTVVDNPDWQRGLSTSLRAGIAAMPEAADAVLLTLCDLPVVTGEDLDALIGAWRVEPVLIAIASFAGGRGPPAIFPRAVWPQFAALRGDQGARSLLEWHEEHILVPMPNAALDVDTPDDLARLEARPAQ